MLLKVNGILRELSSCVLTMMMSLEWWTLNVGIGLIQDVSLNCVFCQFTVKTKLILSAKSNPLDDPNSNETSAMRHLRSAAKKNVEASSTAAPTLKEKSAKKATVRSPTTPPPSSRPVRRSARFLNKKLMAPLLSLLLVYCPHWQESLHFKDRN